MINPHHALMNTNGNGEVLPASLVHSNVIDANMLELDGVNSAAAAAAQHFVTSNQHLHSHLSQQPSQFPSANSDLHLLDPNNVKNPLNVLLQTENDVIMNEAVNANTMPMITDPRLTEMSVGLGAPGTSVAAPPPPNSWRQNFNEYPVKKGRVSKSVQRPFR